MRSERPVKLMIIGGHFPTSIGLLSTVDLAKRSGAECLQIFSKNPSQWFSPKIDEELAEKFVEKCRNEMISPVVIHGSYLMNFAADNDESRTRSINALVHEIHRAEILGASYLVVHMGSHMGAGEKKGIENLASSLLKAVSSTSGSNVSILIETTVGAGTQLGYKFSHIGDVLRMCNAGERIGVCIDTSHIFGAGYDISNQKSYLDTTGEFQDLVGFEHLKLIHANDSKKPCGSRLDRHAHIGQGLIGLEGFRLLVNDERIKDIPMLVETPEIERMHKINIQLLRDLYGLKEGDKLPELTILPPDESKKEKRKTGRV